MIWLNFIGLEPKNNAVYNILIQKGSCGRQVKAILNRLHDKSPKIAQIMTKW